MLCYSSYMLNRIIRMYRRFAADCARQRALDAMYDRRVIRMTIREGIY